MCREKGDYRIRSCANGSELQIQLGRQVGRSFVKYASILQRSEDVPSATMNGPSLEDMRLISLNQHIIKK